ncbi:putative F420-dependent oxidoreductase [Crossiella equi]|uniref:F420-dependent oxidoreductase n=1 Tax=Crossiella equi TaxID=130796 RepID=A0ABS5ACM0_9PSEU|nr:TIGR03620 family F420-dependent LLM class oxidoreductase [Crossiella equi]MBP2474334.1 putative F420-dependent oxidoreductase [Crossiella equi]
MSTDRARFGRVGIWTGNLRAETEAQAEANTGAVALLDELGFPAVWVGGNPTPAQLHHSLAGSSRITVASGILSIWQHTPAEVAASLAGAERFVLGLGASHAKLAAEYSRPYSTMVSYLDELDRVAPELPRVLAALGPKMLTLSAERTIGAHPYLVTSAQVAEARATLGPDALLAPELTVVLEEDPARARAAARQMLGLYLQLPNYTNNWLRGGFTEGDFADGGSDRLVDALFAHGGLEQVRGRVAEFHAAGADHVALQVVSADDPARARHHPEEWRQLAKLL